MKYIKLFEQFEYEEDAWWKEESQFDNIKDLKIIELGGTFYILKKIINDKVFLYDNDYGYDLKNFNLNPIFNENTTIIVIKNDMIQFHQYKDLPEGIKDRLI